MEYTAYVIRGGDCQSSIFHWNKLNMFHGVFFFWIYTNNLEHFISFRSFVYPSKYKLCAHIFFYPKTLNHTFKLTYTPSTDSNELNENAPFRNGKLFHEQYDSAGKLNWKLPVRIEVCKVKKRMTKMHNKNEFVALQRVRLWQNYYSTAQWVNWEQCSIHSLTWILHAIPLPVTSSRVCNIANVRSVTFSWIKCTLSA